MDRHHDRQRPAIVEGRVIDAASPPGGRPGIGPDGPVRGADRTSEADRAYGHIGSDLQEEPLIVDPRPREAVPDIELIRRMQADDLDAFEALFTRYRLAIHRTAYGLTGDPQAAEEVLQDTFARAWQRRSVLRTDISPLPWLHRVALNLCYSRLGRRRLPSDPIDATAAGTVRDAGPEPDERAERQELRRIVRDGIAALSPKHRSVVVLYYLHGLSLQETADALGLRLGTVKSRLHYALRILRGRLVDDRRFGGTYGPADDAILAAAEAEVDAR